VGEMSIFLSGVYPVSRAARIDPDRGLARRVSAPSASRPGSLALAALALAHEAFFLGQPLIFVRERVRG